jgi:hypothetical protein
VKFLELAIKTRRMVGVTYAGMDDFYGGGSTTWLTSPTWTTAPRPSSTTTGRANWVWMTRAEFLARWKARGGGWAFVLLGSPPPPAPGEVKAGCGCKAHAPGTPWPDRDNCGSYTCPANGGKGPCACAVPTYQQCPNGRCPLQPVARPNAPRPPPAAAGAPKVDRSTSSVYVEREMGGGVYECGTGTVLASADGKSLVITNAHVVPDGSRPVAVYAGEKKYPAKWLGSTKLAPGEPDLSALTIDVGIVPAPLADVAPPAGTPVYQWGYGGKTAGAAPTLKCGVVSEQGAWLGPKSLRTSIHSQSGDSGSGVFDSEGRLVGVCWGGLEAPEDSRQFAVKLSAVTAFWKQHLSAVLKPKVEAPPPHTNYGIDRDDLDALTAGGRQRYWIRDRETHQAGALDAIMAGAGLVDDSDRYFLSLVGNVADSRKQIDAILADPRFAPYRDRLHVGCFAPDSWVARDRLKSPLTLQEPAGKGGHVVATLDQLDAELLLQLLKQVFDPPVKPMPKPAPAPAPVSRCPRRCRVRPRPRPPDAPGGTVLTYALGALALWFWLRSRTPTQEKK